MVIIVKKERKGWIGVGEFRGQGKSEWDPCDQRGDLDDQNESFGEQKGNYCDQKEDIGDQMKLAKEDLGDQRRVLDNLREGKGTIGRPWWPCSGHELRGISRQKNVGEIPTRNKEKVLFKDKKLDFFIFVKLRQESGKDRQGMALKAKGLEA